MREEEQIVRITVLNSPVATPPRLHLLMITSLPLPPLIVISFSTPLSCTVSFYPTLLIPPSSSPPTPLSLLLSYIQCLIFHLPPNSHLGSLLHSFIPLFSSPTKLFALVQVTTQYSSTSTKILIIWHVKLEWFYVTMYVNWLNKNGKAFEQTEYFLCYGFSHKGNRLSN